MENYLVELHTQSEEGGDIDVFTKSFNNLEEAQGCYDRTKTLVDPITGPIVAARLWRHYGQTLLEATAR